MVTYLDLLYIIVAGTAYALYQVTMKHMKSSIRLIAFFWIYVLAYAGHLVIYFFRKFILEHNVNAIEILIREFTFYNSPLYLLLGICFTWSLVIYFQLFKRYDLTLIVPFAQIGLLFTYLGYYLLGDPTNPVEFTGVAIICLGAFITGMPTLVNPRKAIRAIPKPLIYGILKKSILSTIAAMSIFFITQQTAINKLVMQEIKHIFPFSFHYSIFQADLGAYFFIVMTLLFYLTHHRQYKGRLLKTLRKHWVAITVACGLYMLSMYAHHFAYLLTPDQTVLAGLTKINVPIILFFGHRILHEKVTPPRIIGCLIVLLGAVVIAYS